MGLQKRLLRAAQHLTYPDGRLYSFDDREMAIDPRYRAVRSRRGAAFFNGLTGYPKRRPARIDRSPGQTGGRGRRERAEISSDNVRTALLARPAPDVPTPSPDP